MKIPREFIDQLLAKADIIDLIHAHVALQKSGSNYFARCPFHQEKRASFSVSQSKQFYHCFGCGAHGNAIDFVMQYEHLNFPEAVESLARQVGLVVPRSVSFVSSEGPSAILLTLLTEVAAFYQSHLQTSPQAKDYLKMRGITGAVAQQFQLGYVPPGWSQVLDRFGNTHAEKEKLLEAGLIIKKEQGDGCYDRFRHRLMFPIHDHRGRIIGFGGRIIDTGEPKYLNSPETSLFQKGHELYGLYQVLKLHRKLDRVLVVEGYMDVIALFQHDITYAVATLGTATTNHHFRRLVRYTSHIIFCFDGDAAGRTAAWRALQVIFPLMQDQLQIHFLFLPEGEDPDTVIRKEGKSNFEKRLASALSLSAFFLQTLGDQCDLTEMEGRARFAASALAYLKQLPEGILLEILLGELAKLARIDINELKKQLMSQSKSQTSAAPIAMGGTGPTPSQAGASPLPQRKLKAPMRAALALLVQNPGLAGLTNGPLLEGHLLGHAFLQRLIDFIKDKAPINTAGLLEHWRGQKEERFIAGLACWKHDIPEAGMVNEFLGILRHLNLLSIEEKINELLAKAAQAELSEQEKQALSGWIMRKQSVFDG